MGLFNLTFGNKVIPAKTQYSEEVEKTFKAYADDQYGNLDPHRYFVVLTISGPRERLEDFRRFVKGYDAILGKDGRSIEKEPSEFCYASIIPFQEGDLVTVGWETLAKAQIKRFGVPGAAMGVQLKEKPTELRYCFIAWHQVPTRIIEALRAKYSDLAIKADWNCERLGTKGEVA
ncbi:MAG: hypothetical protein IPJ71_10535 [Bdellovibrionales bacterium]|nr:hypothetical protein [Bdellovibrionales bacterium]